MDNVIGQFSKDLPAIILRMRKESGLTQGQLARRLIPKATQATVCNWESGKTPVSIYHYLAVCIACGCDASSYLPKTGSKKKEQSKVVR